MRDRTTPFVNNQDPTPASRLPACVVQIYGGELGRRVELSEDDAIIGRDEVNGFSVDLSTVSRRHARLFVREAASYVEDLGSTNGTMVNENEIDGIQQLHNGDLIKCGGAVFKFIEGGNIEALYHEEIYRLTITDGLTQVANKRHFLDFLERELARAIRHHRPLSLVMVDVDHFKKINDEFGHLAGDRVLRGITDTIQKQVRRDELLARYGGEELAVVLAETTIEGAASFCEHAREAVELATYDYDGQPLRATISLGATSMRPEDQIESLIERADALLYRAKADGRNRVAVE